MRAIYAIQFKEENGFLRRFSDCDYRRDTSFVGYQTFKTHSWKAIESESRNTLSAHAKGLRTGFMTNSSPLKV